MFFVLLAAGARLLVLACSPRRGGMSGFWNKCCCCCCCSSASGGDTPVDNKIHDSSSIVTSLRSSTFSSVKEEGKEVREDSIEIFASSPATPEEEEDLPEALANAEAGSVLTLLEVDEEEEDEEVQKSEEEDSFLAAMSDTYEPHDRIRTGAHISSTDDYKAK